MQVLRFEEKIRKSTIEDLLLKLRLVNTPRSVYVNSPGGKFSFFSSLGPAIERQRINTIAGEVSSAAVILYLLGSTRQALPDSTFFFHEIRTLVGPLGEITITQLEEVEEYAKEMSGLGREIYQEWLGQMKAAQAWFLQFLTEKTGISGPTFLNLMRSEATLSAKDAVRYRIVDQIISPASLWE